MKLFWGLVAYLVAPGAVPVCAFLAGLVSRSSIPAAGLAFLSLVLYVVPAYLVATLAAPWVWFRAAKRGWPSWVNLLLLGSGFGAIAGIIAQSIVHDFRLHATDYFSCGVGGAVGAALFRLIADRSTSQNHGSIRASEVTGAS